MSHHLSIVQYNADPAPSTMSRFKTDLHAFLPAAAAASGRRAAQARFSRDPTRSGRNRTWDFISKDSGDEVWCMHTHTRWHSGRLHQNLGPRQQRAFYACAGPIGYRARPFSPANAWRALHCTALHCKYLASGTAGRALLLSAGCAVVAGAGPATLDQGCTWPSGGVGVLGWRGRVLHGGRAGRRPCGGGDWPVSLCAHRHALRARMPWGCRRHAPSVGLCLCVLSFSCWARRNRGCILKVTRRRHVHEH